MGARLVVLAAMALSTPGVALAPEPFLGCAGEHGRVSAATWTEVFEIQRVDSEGRKHGVSLDPRSDSLETMRQVLNEEVLSDLDGAVRDCVPGVVSLLLLTLPLSEAEEGTARARELHALADALALEFADLWRGSDWSIEPSAFSTYRLLLGLQRHDCVGSPLRVFVYNSTLDLATRRLRTGVGMMAAASHVHAFLESGSCVTEDPELADLFFIPAYHGEQYDTFLEFRSHGPDAADVFPYLARNRGADHFFVVSANLPSWTNVEPLRNALLLTVESHQVNDGIPRWYSPWKDVMIPGYIDRWRISAMRSFNKPSHERGFLAVFHGNHPGTHHLYVKHDARVRTHILDEFSGIPDCSVGGHVEDFFDRMGRSHFCLVPRGSSAWTIHLYESFFFGCIPVILSDLLEMPFQEVVDWPSLSIKWPMDNIGPDLLDHLRAIPLDRRAEMKSRLEEAACFFDFHAGWGTPAPANGSWTPWGAGAAAVGADCPFVGRGDASGLGPCLESCDEHAECNAVNFRELSRAAEAVSVGDSAAVLDGPGECVLRACEDVAQPALTEAPGWQAWSRAGLQAHRCSPYAAILRTLEARVRQRPFTHGPHWF